jgi:N-acetylneuraminic acid mutarotase
MPHAHAQHTLTVLASGNVLAYGGCSDDRTTCTFSGSAELYDPDTGTWSSAGTAVPTMWQTATLLHDGRVLFTGGATLGTPASYNLSEVVQLFDPATATWTLGHALPLPLANSVARVRSDGRVLVVGGDWNGSQRTSIYDPTTNTWTAGPGTQWLHVCAPVTAPLPSGGWLVAGGMYWGSPDHLATRAESEIYREEQP